jgi:mandelamide amidase
LNGLVGFRPTVGRYPNDGMTLISTTRDTAGPMVRDVADARLVDAVMAGYPVSTATEIDPRRLRLGIPDTRFTDALEPSLARVFGAALTRLERAGVTLVNVETSEIDRLNNELGGVVLYETAQLMPDYLKRAGFEGSMVDFTASIASADVRDIFGAIFSGTIDEAYYQHAMNTLRPALQQAYRDTLVGPQLDALIFPTVPMAARPLGEDRMSVLFGDQTVNAFGLYIRNTDPGSNAGIPGISVPAGIDARGMPVGVELDGAAGSDDHLLNVAECVERIFADD